MSWTETHRFYAALRVVEAELDRSVDGALPWRDEYADVFGSPSRLRLALHRRWQLLVEAQIDVAVGEDGRPTRQLRRLAAQHRGLLTLLARDEPRWAVVLESDASMVGVA